MNSFFNFLAVAVGGATGSVFRYSLSLLIRDNKLVATFFANITGALAGGFLVYLFSNNKIAIEYKPLIIIGFLGGYTTFSSLTIEVMQLINNKSYILATNYIILSNSIGIICSILGYKIAQSIFHT